MGFGQKHRIRTPSLPSRIGCNSKIMLRPGVHISLDRGKNMRCSRGRRASQRDQLRCRLREFSLFYAQRRILRAQGLRWAYVLMACSSENFAMAAGPSFAWISNLGWHVEEGFDYGFLIHTRVYLSTPPWIHLLYYISYIPCAGTHIIISLSLRSLPSSWQTWHGSDFNGLLGQTPPDVKLGIAQVQLVSLSLLPILSAQVGILMIRGTLPCWPPK